jgi:hypothetical protein
MKAVKTIVCWTVAILAAVSMTPHALAQEANPNKPTEPEKKVGLGWIGEQKAKARQTQAIMNAKQIGIALFQFEQDYGAFPNDKTATLVKTSTGTNAEVKAETANDCFFQLIAAKMIDNDQIFSLEKAKDSDRPANQKPLEKLAKCSYAYVSGLSTTGNPSRPLVVAPLVKGKTTFDPQAPGGKALILRVDCSAVLLPIESDGRVLIDGKDIFDPTQPFWEGKVPTIKWPE